MRDAGEVARILRETERRSREVPSDKYSLTTPDVLLRQQLRDRAVLKLLGAHGFLPLSDRRILDIGCGAADSLYQWEMWGARRSNLAGIELSPGRAEIAKTRFCAAHDDEGRVVTAGADIRTGDASDLPWPAETFDLVVQYTVFTSILSESMRSRVAKEMVRVMRPGGAILWYDFVFDNPANANVSGIPVREVRRLFDGLTLFCRRITLAPPVARRLAGWTPVGVELLESARILNTHVLALARKA